MKVVVKTFLLIALTCCYVNTVFEFCDAEKKINFENESHCYVQQDNSNHQISISKVLECFNFEFGNIYVINSYRDFKNYHFNLLAFKDYPPPKRQLFLQYSSFLI